MDISGYIDAIEKDDVEPCKVTNLAKGDRFRFHVFGFETLSFLIKSFTPPSVVNNPAQIPFPNADYKNPGDFLETGELEVSFFAEENMHTYARVHEWIRNSVPMDFGELKDKETIGLVPFFDSDGRVVLTHVFEGIFPTSIIHQEIVAAEETPAALLVSVTFSVNDYYLDLAQDS